MAMKTPDKKRERERKRMARRRQDPAFRAAESAYNKKYRQKNKERLRENDKKYQKANLSKIRIQRKSWKSLKYATQVASLVKNHNNLCDICAGPPDGRWKKLNIDHCHEKGHFRGLLCSRCNLALGYFRDDVTIMQKAIEYLNRTVFRGDD